jgi:hypothetical protein
VTANTESTHDFEPLIQWLTPVEIAYALNLDVKTIQLWLRDPNHPLVGRKIGSVWRVHPADFKRFLTQENSKP